MSRYVVFPDAQDSAGTDPATSEPEVTIAIPAYNEADHLPDTLACAREAADAIPQQVELLVCDDGSTDATPDILADAASTHDRVRVLTNEENRGIVPTCQRLLEAARGETFVRLDADTELPPGTLATICDRLDDGADIVFPFVAVQNTEVLHGAAIQAAKIQGDAQTHGGACFGVRTADLRSFGGFQPIHTDGGRVAQRWDVPPQNDNEVQALRQRARRDGWAVADLEDHAVRSVFPTDWRGIFWRKYGSSQSNLRDEASWREKARTLRGAIAWTVVAGLLAAAGSILGGIGAIHWRRSRDVVAESGQWWHRPAYVGYKFVSAWLRTVGVWVEAIYYLRERGRDD